MNPLTKLVILSAFILSYVFASIHSQNNPVIMDNSTINQSSTKDTSLSSLLKDPQLVLLKTLTSDTVLWLELFKNFLKEHLLEPLPLETESVFGEDARRVLKWLDPVKFSNALEKIGEVKRLYGLNSIENEFFNKEVIVGHLKKRIEGCEDRGCLVTLMQDISLGMDSLAIYLEKIMSLVLVAAERANQFIPAIIALHFGLIDEIDALRSAKETTRMILEKEALIEGAPFAAITQARRLYANLLGDSFMYHVEKQEEIGKGRFPFGMDYRKIKEAEAVILLDITPSMYLYIQAGMMLDEKSSQTQLDAWRKL